MSAVDDTRSLEAQFDQWRGYLRRRQALQSADVAELEGRLRAQVARLVEGGLAADEAFLVAAKRMGNLDALSREFARERSGQLLRHLGAGAEAPSSRSRTDTIVAFALAVAAAVAVKLPVLFGMQLDRDAGFYARNLGLLVLPFLAGYFAWKRQLGWRTLGWLAAGFAVAAVFANSYPYPPAGATQALAALHLPIALWLAIGVAYAGSRWREVDGRMDFIRFSGELFIHYVLIALGGGVLAALVTVLFEAIGISAEALFATWLLPCGAAGGVLVAAWLVEARQGVIGNLAPMLTRLFTPFFALVLVVFLVTVLWTGRGVEIERNELIAFDLLLVLVLGLLLYWVSARDPRSPPDVFDGVQVLLAASALLVDALALWAIAARINEFGFTPNRVAALGENLILLANLAWSIVLYVRFLRGRGPFAQLERWQTRYLYVYVAWAAVVVAVFPPLFHYV